MIVVSTLRGVWAAGVLDAGDVAGVELGVVGVLVLVLAIELVLVVLVVATGLAVLAVESFGVFKELALEAVLLLVVTADTDLW